MVIEVVPELGFDMPSNTSYMDLRERVAAACQTAELLEASSKEDDDDDIAINLSDLTDFDKELVATLASGYAEDPEGISKQVTASRMGEISPAAIVKINRIMDDFGRIVVQDATKIRQLVTNKLILESESDDARVRLKALELLGKISDVGLFTEKRDITITHQTTSELRDSLRSKLAKLVNDPGAGASHGEDGENGEEIADAEYEEVSNE